MSFIRRRDRVLIFRLTQDEYDHLVTASAERGARNLSDFARSELLAVVGNAPQEKALEGRLSTVEQQLSDMKSDMRKITRLLERMAGDKQGGKVRA